MYIHNLDPVMFHIGPFEARYYGLVYVLTAILCYYFLRKNKDKLKLTNDNVDSFLMQIILGVVIGARLFQVLVWEPAYYLANPFKIIALWEGGMSLHGGILGIALVGYLFCRKHKISIAKLADILIIPLMIGLAFGRIANFINGEIIGTITSLPWCVQFPSYNDCMHPVQLYASAGRFILVGFLIYLIKARKNLKQGCLTWTALCLMSLGRFFLDFIREDPRFLGLSLGQYLSLLLFIISAVILYKYYYKKSFKYA